MKLLLLNIAFFSCFFSYAQITSVIVSSENNKPISYVNVWIENENIGTTSNKKGLFNLNKIKKNANKNLVLSAVGFKTKKINVSSIKDTITLKPKAINSDEKTLKKSDKRIKIDNFLHSKINFFYGSGETPWMTGKIFPYKKHYKNTPFLRSFKIFTRSAIDSAKFNVRIYKKGKDLELQDELHQNKITAIAKKGNVLTIVDLSNLNIRFPEEGIVIVFEWLIIEDNKKVYKTLFNEKGEETKLFSFGPLVGALPALDAKNSIVYREGLWKKPIKTPKNAVKNYRNKHSIIAMELTLTD